MTAGQTVANQVILPVGDKSVRLYTTAQTDLLVDVVGYFRSGADLVPLTPRRLLVRVPMAAGTTRTVTVAGRAGLPSTGVGAPVLNLTAAGPDYRGWLTAWPAGSPRPWASNVNYQRGRDIAGMSAPKVGTSGRVALYSSVATDVLADVTG